MITANLFFIFLQILRYFFINPFKLCMLLRLLLLHLLHREFHQYRLVLCSSVEFIQLTLVSICHSNRSRTFQPRNLLFILHNLLKQLYLYLVFRPRAARPHFIHILKAIIKIILNLHSNVSIFIMYSYKIGLGIGHCTFSMGSMNSYLMDSVRYSIIDIYCYKGIHKISLTYIERGNCEWEY